LLHFDKENISYFIYNTIQYNNYYCEKKVEKIESAQFIGGYFCDIFNDKENLLGLIKPNDLLRLTS